MREIVPTKSGEKFGCVRSGFGFEAFIPVSGNPALRPTRRGCYGRSKVVRFGDATY